MLRLVMIGYAEFHQTNANQDAAGTGGLGCRRDPLQPTSLTLDRNQIERIVREYLLEYPEVIEEAMIGLSEKRELEEQERQRAVIAAHTEALQDHPLSPVSGNVDGDIAVVEFFDYQCPYCKRALGPVTELLETDSQVRVVWKEYPILGPDSRFAARAAMAAERQGHYHEFHVALMSESNRLSEERTIEIATDIGLDIDKLREDMEDPAIESYLDETAQLANVLGIRGTPAFVIGDILVPGAVDTDRMREVIAQVRAGR
ncbi:MAG: DsbA family protein [Aphanocapsa feldmannii 277cI]|uniref:DsbA family protein n=2 Tax=Aphanocapsa feldmannii TaxID=192050 RepID=A0A524RU67_9CHRO|nr:MAG: DsbA family protein [Aphanocapsa feldmannii 277cI]